MLPHEYAVIGHSRTVWGRHLGTAAAVVASTASAVAVAGFKFAQELGLGETGQVIFWPVTAALIFPFAHLAFDRWVWKWRRVSTLLKIPDLNGEWDCKGKTTSITPHREWSGTVIIDQSWEKIKVHIKTDQSSSHSISASLIHEPRVGYRLMYSYRNSPRIGEPELSSHVGFCEFIFSENLISADGEYFNNHGRTTSGQIHLTRRIANGN
ncbi:hypothetical protein [Rhodospirillum centenum]|uniref:Cap15 family cyclic dinucleotide receptor domain-containing protein n=1 Tax=Rhodospirillum centenum TaxID=34018 RepID=UPI0011D16376|nr:hypothetical protein [Rhodospirillum centenum]